jgi:hypothetical protein
LPPPRRGRSASSVPPIAVTQPQKTGHRDKWSSCELTYAAVHERQELSAFARPVGVRHAAVCGCEALEKSLVLVRGHLFLL